MSIYKAHIHVFAKTAGSGATSLLPLLIGPMKKPKCHLSSFAATQPLSLCCHWRSAAKSTTITISAPQVPIYTPGWRKPNGS